MDTEEAAEQEQELKMNLAPRRLQHIRDLVQVNAQNAALDLADAQALVRVRRERRERNRRRWWIRPWIVNRPLLGQYQRLMRELSDEDRSSFRNFVRMDPPMFDELLQRIGPRIGRQDTNYRKALEPGLKLAITLRFMATGDSYKSLMYGFRVPHNTISLIVKQVCQAIVQEYAEEVIQCPTTEQEWRAIAEQFERRWNFPHALGALDGKHVGIRQPRGGGSVYYNYKGFHSIILMALVDADYKFLWVDVGTAGSTSDCAIFNLSELKEMFEADTIGVPAPDPLTHDDQPTPYFLIGDDAFPLRTWLMKPFSQRQLNHEKRIFNYRLSRARRIVENAFGILANRFGCLLTHMRQQPRTVTTITEACVCLHNLMRIRYPGQQNALVDQEDEDHQVVPGAWRDGRNMEDMEDVAGGNRATMRGKAQRLYLTHYVNSAVGSVPWQDRIVLPPPPEPH